MTIMAPVSICSLLAISSVLVARGISMPAGYYSLEQIAAAITASGTRVVVDAKCAAEVYAVQLSHQSPQAVLEALVATGRVESDSQNPIKFRPSKRVSDDNPVILEKYYRDCLDPGATIEARVADVLDQLAGAAPEERARVADSFWKRAQASSKPSDGEFGNLVYQAIESENVPYASLRITSAQCALGEKALGRIRFVEVDDEPNLCFPAGFRNSTHPFEQLSPPYPPPKDLVAVKLATDPISGTTVSRVLFGESHQPKGALIATGPHVLTVRSYSAGPPSPTEVLSTTELSAYTRRLTKTSEALGNATLIESAELTRNPMRVSARLLAICERTGDQIMAYVSPIGDRYLPGTDRASVRTTLEQVNTEGFDLAFERIVFEQRVGPAQRFVGNRSAWNPFTATRIDQILAVRSETDFLDKLVEGSPTLPLAFENRIWRGEAPTLLELATSVSSERLSGWKGSTFSSAFLPFVNPTSFYPFAKALMVSPKLTGLVEAMNATGNLEIPWDNLDPSVRKAITSGIEDAGPHCDDYYDRTDPMSAASLVGNEEPDRQIVINSLRVRRIGASLVFEIRWQMGAFWRSTVRPGSVK